MKCWQCNAPVTVHIVSWLCPHCGQHGQTTDPPPNNWQDAAVLNSPYQDKVTTFMLYTLSFLQGVVSGATVFFIPPWRTACWPLKNTTPIHRPTQQMGSGIGFLFTVVAMCYTLYTLR